MSAPRVAAIIGGGVIGGGWAARFLLNGWDVRVFDPAPDAKARLDAVLAHARRSLPMLYDHALPDEGRLTWADSIAAAVEGADWVQESVPERLDLKAQTYAEIEAAAGADTLIGSSTSGFRPSELRRGLRHPARLMVAHPFNPVYLLPLVELVPGDAGERGLTDAACAILRGIGMHPLVVRKEIDAHIADRLLESVWREALWLVRDGVATTAEIDDAIRLGFGLRWGQMGLFETYRIGGGPAGMRHFLAQFGPALAWPWSRLTDVPEYTDELVELIASQSDAQSGHLTPHALETLRDDNLVAMIRALKPRGVAAGGVVAAHEVPHVHQPEAGGPLQTVRRTVPVDWTDYNGHMNESRYGQVYSDAADAVLAHVGADAAYVAGGFSFFTAEITIRYRAEALAGDRIHVETTVLQAEGKKLRLAHRMLRDGVLLSEAEQFLLHVDLGTRKSCAPPPELAARLATLRTSTGDGAGTMG
ncbi:carnitine 3-dehydrogenase [Oceanibium sediminis]|uniref:carnitine 3-dehydrogenase n=1 Tax=Oceanibium sediminis TaxID=2026339 RepID=UPI000DD4D630|nr:carnitine 3-dehydrogenase [Oceanibium sediminis]